MQVASFEERQLEHYLQRTRNECPFADWARQHEGSLSLIAVEGFEERSVGILEAIAQLGLPVREAFVATYMSNEDANARYRERFERALRQLSAHAINRLHLTETGDWLREALSTVTATTVLVDITGLSTRSLFGALDAAAHQSHSVVIGYTEAGEYWPTKAQWEELCQTLSNPTAIPDVVDQQPWLFGHEHRVELVPNHEGYDSVGSGRALVGFLPFKSARLAAVLAQEEYEEFVFVAGRPRLAENHWRLQALRQINQNITRDRRVMEMSTFGYRAALEQLSRVLYKPIEKGLPPLVERYDVHLALLGSKLQDVACWALSCMVPGITVVTSVPKAYFAGSFSERIGMQWAFPLFRPV
jgi:hypothetical protein